MSGTGLGSGVEAWTGRLGRAIQGGANTCWVGVLPITQQVSGSTLPGGCGGQDLRCPRGSYPSSVIPSP